MSEERYSKPTKIPLDSAQADKVAEAAPKPVNINMDSTVKPLVALDQPEPDDDIAIVMPKRSRLGRWFWGSLGGFVTVAAGFEAYQFTSAVWAENIVLGIGLAAVLGVAAVSGLGLLWREFRSIKSVRRQQRFRARASEIIEQESFGEAEALLSDITEQLPGTPSSAGLGEYRLRKQSSHDDGELIQIYSTTVLAGLDERAYKVMVKHASEAAVLVAISPLALADMALVSWRSFRMMQEIAAIYGCQSAFFGKYDLFKKVLRNMMLAGAGELVADAGVEIVGGSLSSVVSAKVAQAVGVGVITARLGIHAMQVCRPLPFSEQERPRLSKVRTLLLGKVKDIVRGKEAKSKDKQKSLD